MIQRTMHLAQVQFGPLGRLLLRGSGALVAHQQRCIQQSVGERGRGHDLPAPRTLRRQEAVMAEFRVEILADDRRIVDRVAGVRDEYRNLAQRIQRGELFGLGPRVQGRQSNALSETMLVRDDIDLADIRRQAAEFEFHELVSSRDRS